MIQVIEIFEKVNLIRPVEQRRFFNALNDTLWELRATYHDIQIKVTNAGGEDLNGKAHALMDKIDGLDLYLGAIVDNINFICGGEEKDKGEFVRKADLAHKTDWKKRCFGKVIKRMEW